MCSSGGCQESELLESWGGGRATHRTPGHQLRRREEPGGLGEGGGEGDSGLVSVVGRGGKAVARGSRSQAAMPLPMEDSSSPALYVPVLAEGVQHLCPQDLWAEQELEGRRSASTSSEFLPTPAALPRGGLA